MRLPFVVRLMAGLAALSLAGCGCGKSDGALKVVVTVEPSLTGTCLSLEISKDGLTRVTQDLARTANKNEFIVGLKQGELPSDIQLIARTWSARSGEGCSLPRVLTSASPTVDATFPRSGVTTTALDVGAPGPSLDLDRDLHVDIAKGGDDCDDTRSTIHPGLAADCASTEDNDCDGKIGCADSECLPAPGCNLQPTSLVFTTPARVVESGVCGSDVLTVEARDNSGAAVGVLTATAVTLVADQAGVTFYSDPSCGTPLTGAAIAVAQGSSTASFYVKAASTQATVLTATLSGVPPTTQTLTVTPADGSTKLVFTTGQQTITAGGCSPRQTVQRQDAMGAPVTTGVPLAVALSSTATSGLTFHADTACTAPAVTQVTIPGGLSTVDLYVSATVAQTVTLTGASAGLISATQLFVTNAGPPFKLAFPPPAQAVPALGCSAVATVALQDNSGNTLTSTQLRSVALSATPLAANTTFYSDGNCTTPLASDVRTMASGASTVTLFFKADFVGPIVLTAASAGLVSGTQGANIDPAKPTKLVITTPALTVEAGFCLPLTVERQDSLSRATSPNFPTAVTLDAAPPTGINFFIDSLCGVPAVGALDIPSASPNSLVYAKGTTGSVAATIPAAQAHTLTASSVPLSTGTLVVNVLPMVRRGSCSIANAALTVSCPVTPAIPLNDISRTLMLFQATGAQNNPSDANASCHLSGGASVQVICDREGGGGALSIQWQTVSFARDFAGGGASIQHFSGAFGGATPNPMAVTVTTVDLGRSFVLFGASSSGGTNGGDDMLTSRFTTTTNVEVHQNSLAATFPITGHWSVQAVSLANANVLRGTATTAAPSASVVVGLLAPVADLTRTFTLYTAREDPPDTAEICKRRFRGVVTDPATLTFTRGDGASGVCIDSPVTELTWERIELPMGCVVQAPTITHLLNSATGAAAALGTPVELTRSVVFMAGQAQGGQAAGESNYLADDVIGTVLGLPSFDDAGTQVSVTRAAALGTATFTPFVVQFDP